MKYDKYEMEVLQYDVKDTYVVCSIIDEEDGPGYSYDSLKPDRSDS